MAEINGGLEATLYYDPKQTQSRRVLIAFEELGIKCHSVIIDELKGDNLSKNWFTRLGTQGQFPVLAKGCEQF